MSVREHLKNKNLRIKDLGRVDKESQRLTAKVATLEAELKFMQGILEGRTRVVYPKDHPREEGTGRAIVECRICYQVKPQRGHGICHRCYNRMWYRKVGVHKRLGGKWISRANLQKILGRQEGGAIG